MNWMEDLGWLRWFVFLFALLAIIFFGAGLVNPTVEYESEVKIFRPRMEVWGFFNTDSLLGEWVSEVDSVALIHGDSLTEGAVYRLWMQSGNQSFTMDREITSVNPPEFIAFHYDAFSMEKTDAYTFQQQGEHTLIQGHFKLRGANYLDRCVFAFMGGYFKQIDRRYLVQFKEMVHDR